MKRIVFTLAIVLATIAPSAGARASLPASSQSATVAPAPARPSSLAPQSQQVWWGMWNSTMGLQPVDNYAVGTNNSAIRLMSNAQARLKGCQAHGLRFYIGDKTAVSNVRVWLSVARYDGVNGAPDLLVKDVAASDLRDFLHDGAPTEVLFDEAVDILPASNPYASVYAGFTFTLANGGTCQMMAQANAPGAGNSNIYGTTDIASTHGALALQLLVSGSSLPACAVSPTAFADLTTLAGSTLSADLSLVADGTDAVSDIDYVVTLNGSAQPQRHATLPQPLTELGAAATLAVTIDLPSTPQAYDCDISITRVNGQPNQSDAATIGSQVLALSRWGEKRAVLEEFTGTWCANCVRGITGLRLLDQQFGERFIGIAVHNDDPMKIEAYDQSKFVRSKVSKLGGYPSSTIDRWIDGDPYMGQVLEYHFTTDRDVALALAQPAVADVALTARWADDGHTVIDLDAETTFWYNSTEAPFALALVLTADGLTGTGKPWMQRNGLVGRTDLDDDLALFANGTVYMEVEYDHVAVFVEGVESGIAGSIAAPLVSGAAQRYHYSLPASLVVSSYDATAEPLIQDPDRLHAVAMLIDQRTGRIANAAKAHVQPHNALSVGTPAAATASAPQYFDPQGRRLSSPRRGLNIVRTPGGKTVKQVF